MHHDSVHLGWDPRLWISNKHPRDAAQSPPHQALNSRPQYILTWSSALMKRVICSPFIQQILSTHQMLGNHPNVPQALQGQLQWKGDIWAQNSSWRGNESGRFHGKRTLASSKVSRCEEGSHIRVTTKRLLLHVPYLALIFCTHLVFLSDLYHFFSVSFVNLPFSPPLKCQSASRLWAWFSLSACTALVISACLRDWNAWPRCLWTPDLSYLPTSQHHLEDCRRFNLNMFIIPSKSASLTSLS